MVTVGKVRDAHGLKGELFIILFSKESAWSEKLEEFVLLRREKVENKTLDVPHRFSVKRLKNHKVGLILRPEELSDRTQAEGFRGALFQIPESLLVADEGDGIFLKEIENFEVRADGKTLGPIIGFSSNGPQDIIQVKTKDGVVEILLVKEFIESIDYEGKVIEMKLPDGFLDPH